MNIAFERDKAEIKKNSGNGIVILRGRKAEIAAVEKRLRETRNAFVAQCCQQQLEKLRNEYRILNDMI